MPDQNQPASPLDIMVSAMKNMGMRLAEVETLFRTMQQTVNMAARQPLNGRRPVRCLFIIHYVESWDTFADLFDAMVTSPDFEPVVATVHRLAGRSPDRYEDEQINHDELTRMGIPHIRLNMPNSFEALDIIKAMRPDIIFRQAPWEITLPPAFTAPELTFSRLCYIPYSFMAIRRYSTKEDASEPCSKMQTDQLFHRLCWRIFCETDMHREMSRLTALRGDSNVVVSGYPKFDRLHEAKQRPPFWPIAAKEGKRRLRLIWAPHHSLQAEWLNFATFPTMYREMLAWASRATDEVEIVMKPHPALFGKLVESGTLTARAVMDFLDTWKSLPNAALVEGADYGPLFNASDVMLTDGVSFLFEYPVFDKPLIFLDSGASVGFNEAGEIGIKASHRVKTFDEARALCEKFARGEADDKAEIRQQAMQKLWPYPGQSAQKILDAILQGLDAESGSAR